MRALIVLLLLTPLAAAQEQRTVQILHADSLVGRTEGGERVRELIGAVRLRQDSTDLAADRAVQYLDREEVLLLGRVVIANPGDTLWARQVRYNTATKVGRAEGGVRVADSSALVFSDRTDYFSREDRAVFPDSVRLLERGGTAVLTSRRGRYDTASRTADFEGDVRLVDSTTVLTSDVGRYATRERRADFYGRVRLDERQTRLESDSLTHFRDTERSVGRGRVRLRRLGGEDEPDAPQAAPDSSERTLLWGAQIAHDGRAGTSRARGGYARADARPLLMRLATDSSGVTDSLLVIADAFDAFQLDSLAPTAYGPDGRLVRVVATGAVRLWGADLQAAGDSAVFDRAEGPDSLGVPPRDESRLFGRAPAAWFSDTQVTGDTLRATARDGSLDSLHAHGRAFAASLDTALARVNQVRGRRLLALFREDSLRSLHVWPTAEAVYFRRDEEAGGGLAGAVQVSADSLAFRFRADSLEAVRAYRGVEGTYYDAPLVPAALRLDGYRFEPDQRPTRRALLDALREPDPEATPEGQTLPIAVPADAPAADAPADTVASPPDPFAPPPDDGR